MKKFIILTMLSLIFIFLFANDTVKITFPEGKTILDYRGLPVFQRTYDNWLESWRSQQVDTYIKFYHPEFISNTGNQNFEAWSKHKRQVFNPTRRVEVDFMDLNLTIIDENNIEMMAYQDYRSWRFNDFGLKKMTWKREGGQWRIMMEDWTLATRPEPPPIEPEEPPIVIVEPRPDPFKAVWEARVNLYPYEFINFILSAPIGIDRYFFIIEKKDQYAGLYLFDENFRNIELVKTYFISSGQVQGNKEVRGDLKTPEGIYYTTRFIPESNLESKFGSGAFVLDYPNELDRLRKKTGSGIWIHGSDIEMVDFDTEGCIRFENQEITHFYEDLKLRRAAAIIANEIEWIDRSALDKEAEKINKFLKEWEESWEQQNIERYLSFYDKDEFISHRQKFDFESWERHKRNIFNPNRPIKVDFTGFNYHYADNLLLVVFFQDYNTGSYNDFGRKQLILHRDKEQNVWKIVQEEWVASRKTKNTEIGNNQ